MRPLRDRLSPLAGAALACAACWAGAAAADGGARAAYLPLAVGNSWTYACSAEGTPQFRKTQRIVAVTPGDGGQVYRSELRVGKDPKPLVTYYLLAADGRVTTSTQSNLAAALPVIGADPQRGQRFGELKVSGTLRYDRGRFRNTPAVRLENFDQESPTLSEEQRLQWKSRVYGKGVGLLEEADGLGGACLLTGYQLRPS
jgi:hypothetical protein